MALCFFHFDDDDSIEFTKNNQRDLVNKINMNLFKGSLHVSFDFDDYIHALYALDNGSFVVLTWDQKYFIISSDLRYIEEFQGPDINPSDYISINSIGDDILIFSATQLIYTLDLKTRDTNSLYLDGGYLLSCIETFDNKIACYNGNGLIRIISRDLKVIERKIYLKDIVSVSEFCILLKRGKDRTYKFSIFPYYTFIYDKDFNFISKLEFISAFPEVAIPGNYETLGDRRIIMRKDNHLYFYN